VNSWAEYLTNHFFSKSKNKVLSVSAIAVVFLLLKLRYKNDKSVESDKIKTDNVRIKSKGYVDKVFFERIWEMIKIVVPNWYSKEAFDLYLLSLFLVARTFLSIYIARINGDIVK
jgi:ATP-binding cassette subfamily D (ALD) protein 3